MNHVVAGAAHHHKITTVIPRHMLTVPISALCPVANVVHIKIVLALAHLTRCQVHVTVPLTAPLLDNLCLIHESLHKSASSVAKSSISKHARCNLEAIHTITLTRSQTTLIDDAIALFIVCAVDVEE
jgi:hypothetical protein